MLNEWKEKKDKLWNGWNVVVCSIKKKEFSTKHWRQKSKAFNTHHTHTDKLNTQLDVIHVLWIWTMSIACVLRRVFSFQPKIKLKSWLCWTLLMLNIELNAWLFSFLYSYSYISKLLQKHHFVRFALYFFDKYYNCNDEMTFIILITYRCIQLIIVIILMFND